MKQILKFCMFAVCVYNVAGDTCKVSDIPPDPNSKCCGVHLASDHVRREQGDASLNQFPWLVLIEDQSNRITCTGALISSRYVLTAAQCGMQHREPKSVRLGEYNKTNAEPDCLMVNGAKKCADRVITVPIEFMLPHPDFSRQNLRGNDIAVIKLRRSVPYTEYIRPICLPTFDVYESPAKNLKFIVAGWGSKPSSLEEDDVVKHYVEVPYKSLETCKSAYENYRQGRFVISDLQICAGGERDRDACRGDGGGPLIHEKNGKHTAVGIVSYGPSRCGSDGIPSVYTNVYKYLPWIKSVIKNFN